MGRLWCDVGFSGAMGLVRDVGKGEEPIISSGKLRIVIGGALDEPGANAGASEGAAVGQSVEIEGLRTNELAGLEELCATKLPKGEKVRLQVNNRVI